MIHVLPFLVASALSQAVVDPKAPPSPPSPAAPAVADRPMPAPLPASASPVADAKGNAGIATLVAPDARPDQVLRDLVFAEGPATDGFGSTYFCDLSRGDVWRIVPGNKGIEAQRILEDSKGCAGLAFSRSGRLYSTQMYTGRIVELQLLSDGTARPRGVVETYGGEPRPGVNDLVTTPDGGIWFTNMGDKRRPGRKGLYYTNEEGAEPVRVEVPLERPNGVRLSPDGRTLYVVDFGAPWVWSFPVEGPGKVGAPRRFASLSVVGDPAKVTGGDGLAVDALGNLWVAVPMASAVAVFDPQGAPLGRVMLPEYPSNCAFGGADGRSLFITARTSVYMLPTIVEGFWTARGGSPTVTVPADVAAPAAPATPVIPGAK